MVASVSPLTRVVTAIVSQTSEIVSQVGKHFRFWRGGLFSVLNISRNSGIGRVAQKTVNGSSPLRAQRGGARTTIATPVAVIAMPARISTVSDSSKSSQAIAA